jgi:hypothetical protein
MGLDSSPGGRRTIALLGLLCTGIALAWLGWTIAGSDRAVGHAAAPPAEPPRPAREVQQLAEPEPVVADAPDGADEQAPEPEETRTPAADASAEDVTSWLRRVSPEKFRKLTPAQASALTELDLRGAPIGDADLRFLLGLPNLRTLGLRGTAITDEGLAVLGGIPLESLDLRGTRVTGRGLAALPASSLTALHLTSTAVEGADLARMPPMPRLATLKLNSLAVDDASLESLAIYPSLRHLELDNTGLTDAGLRRLLELQPSLRRIEARGTQVTAGTVAELRTAHPGLEVVFEDPDPRQPGR